MAVPGPWESAGGLPGIGVVVCVTHPHTGKIGPHMSGAMPECGLQQDRGLLGRAGINSLGMLESLRSPDRRGIQPGPGGQRDPKGQVRKGWGKKARRDWGSVRAN